MQLLKSGFCIEDDDGGGEIGNNLRASSASFVRLIELAPRGPARVCSCQISDVRYRALFQSLLLWCQWRWQSFPLKGGGGGGGHRRGTYGIPHRRRRVLVITAPPPLLLVLFISWNSRRDSVQSRRVRSRVYL